jgi:oxygen-dependent protoporphyrinogen oxidase
MKPVAIIGAGITGLTAAFYLKRRNIPVTVYEAGERVGGAIQSMRQNGYLAEFGPNTILETSPKINQFVRDAGLESRRLDSDPKAMSRYVVRYKRPIVMSSPLGFFTTKLFTAKAKLAVLCEPFVPRRRDGEEESVAEFVVRRLNQEFLDHAIDALVAGVYAGDPYKLSLPQAFPRLAGLESRYGSLIKGQIFGARERKRRGEIAKDRAPKFSFDEGLQVLPDTLRELLGDAVKLNTAVSRLAQTADGWRVSTSNGESEHSAVVFCGTAHRLAELKVELSAGVGRAGSPLPAVRPKADDDAHGVTHPASKMNLLPFSEIRYPPVASVVLGFRRKDVKHPCEGYGMLIPKIEGFKILGTIFSSSLFPNRAPAGHILLTSYIGGERQPELALLSPEKLVAMTHADLRVLLGVNGEPTFRFTSLYPKAIPQYNVGYGRHRERMNEIENKAAGLFFAGHYRDGVSLGDSIVSGCNIVERMEKFLKAK